MLHCCVDFVILLNLTNFCTSPTHLFLCCNLVCANLLNYHIARVAPAATVYFTTNYFTARRFNLCPRRYWRTLVCGADWCIRVTRIVQINVLFPFDALMIFCSFFYPFFLQPARCTLKVPDMQLAARALHIGRRCYRLLFFVSESLFLATRGSITFSFWVFYVFFASWPSKKETSKRRTCTFGVSCVHSLFVKNIICCPFDAFIFSFSFFCGRTRPY